MKPACKLVFYSPKDVKKRLEAAFQLNVYTMWYVRARSEYSPL